MFNTDFQACIQPGETGPGLSTGDFVTVIYK